MPLPSPVQSELIRSLARFRAEQARGDAATIRQLATAYNKIYRRLQDELELEVRRIFEKPESIVTRAYITRRLERLTEEVHRELERYQAVLASTIDVSTDQALLQGSKHALEMMRLATLGRKSLLSVDFGVLKPEQINTMIGFLAPGSPLFRNIEKLARFHSPLVRDRLVEAIALGYGPGKAAKNIEPYLAQVAKSFQISLARPFADAVRLTRTANLWAYREAARANYQANGDVVNGWTWHASLDSVTCPACISLHGSIHPLDEPLEGHYHCRCAAVPVVLGQPLVPEGAGLEWFGKQSEAMQKQILGPGAFDAWKAGQIDFSQLHKRTENETYGFMEVVTPLKDLIGAE